MVTSVILDSPSVMYSLRYGLDKKSNWSLKFRYTKPLSNPSSFRITKHGQWEQETYVDSTFLIIIVYTTSFMFPGNNSYWTQQSEHNAKSPPSSGIFSWNVFIGLAMLCDNDWVTSSENLLIQSSDGAGGSVVMANWKQGSGQ